MVFPPWRQTFLPPREAATRARTTRNLHRCVETQQQPNQVAPPKPNHETKPPHESHDLRVVFWVWENETILRFARHLFGPGQAWKGREEREGSSSALSVCGYILKFLYDTIWLNNSLCILLNLYNLYCNLNIYHILDIFRIYALHSLYITVVSPFPPFFHVVTSLRLCNPSTDLPFFRFAVQFVMLMELVEAGRSRQMQTDQTDQTASFPFLLKLFFFEPALAIKQSCPFSESSRAEQEHKT